MVTTEQTEYNHDQTNPILRQSGLPFAEKRATRYQAERCAKATGSDQDRAHRGHRRGGARRPANHHHQRGDGCTAAKQLRRGHLRRKTHAGGIVAAFGRPHGAKRAFPHANRGFAAFEKTVVATDRAGQNPQPSLGAETNERRRNWLHVGLGQRREKRRHGEP